MRNAGMFFVLFAFSIAFCIWLDASKPVKEQNVVIPSNVAPELYRAWYAYANTILGPHAKTHITLSKEFAEVMTRGGKMPPDPTDALEEIAAAQSIEISSTDPFAPVRIALTHFGRFQPELFTATTDRKEYSYLGDDHANLTLISTTPLRVLVLWHDETGLGYLRTTQDGNWDPKKQWSGEDSFALNLGKAHGEVDIYVLAGDGHLFPDLVGGMGSIASAEIAATEEGRKTLSTFAERIDAGFADGSIQAVDQCRFTVTSSSKTRTEGR